MKKLLMLGSILSILLACKTEEKSKLVYAEEGGEQEETQLIKDSSLVITSDLPIHFDSTDFLIYPIGSYKVYESSGRSYGSSSYSHFSFQVASVNGNKITGDLNNIKFENLNTGEVNSLTQKSMVIKSVAFLNKYYEITGKGILVYEVIDEDTNRDRKLNRDDVSAFYISYIDGSSFQKLTPDFQDFIDWKYIQRNGKLYFRSVEDTNKNGKLDKKDKVFNFYIQLESGEWEVKEYSVI